jgi:hypothetical protein
MSSRNVLKKREDGPASGAPEYIGRIRPTLEINVFRADSTRNDSTRPLDRSPLRRSTSDSHSAVSHEGDRRRGAHGISEIVASIGTSVSRARAPAQRAIRPARRSVPRRFPHV